MHFANPLILNFLFLIPLLAVFYIFCSCYQKKVKQKIGNLDIIEKISSPLRKGIQKLKIFLVFASIFLIILCLSRPQMGKKPIKITRKGIDIVFCVDTSLSMNAQDIKPNRLMRTKQEISSFLKKMGGDRIGLVAFAGESFVQCPLTLDKSALRIFLDVLDTDLIPQAGTNLEKPIKLALSLLTKKEVQIEADKVIILITDGESHLGNPLSAANLAKQKKIRIYTIGIGSINGEPIPVYNEKRDVKGYKKDKQGKIVMSKLNADILQRIAAVSGGEFYHLVSSGSEMDKIISSLSRLHKEKFKQKIEMEYKDRFQYFLLFALIFLGVEFVLRERR